MKSRMLAIHEGANCPQRSTAHPINPILGFRIKASHTTRNTAARPRLKVQLGLGRDSGGDEMNPVSSYSHPQGSRFPEGCGSSGPGASAPLPFSLAFSMLCQAMGSGLPSNRERGRKDRVCGMTILAKVRLTDRCHCSTSRIISSFSVAGSSFLLAPSPTHVFLEQAIFEAEVCHQFLQRQSFGTQVLHIAGRSSGKRPPGSFSDPPHT